VFGLYRLNKQKCPTLRLYLKFGLYRIAINSGFRLDMFHFIYFFYLTEFSNEDDIPVLCGIPNSGCCFTTMAVQVRHFVKNKKNLTIPTAVNCFDSNILPPLIAYMPTL
jgi:hypothetical protein